ncbi:MAG: PorT family protein [Bacteroidales bacterium]|nr:PorT family protein [Bacteroidales bacterium]
MKTTVRLIAFLGVVTLLSLAYKPSRAQVFGIKGGAAFGSVSTKEVDSVVPMFNYYYETYFSYRFSRYKYWTVGIGYFGAGATFCDVEHPNDIPYKAKVRFNNIVMPLKIKVSAEGKRKPRPYAFIGAMPAVMYNEDKTLTFDNVRPGTRTDYVFQWTPRRVNIYAIGGAGCYYKHFTLDVSFSINALRDYKEIEAPISYNKNVIFTIGYQISRDAAKVW